VVIIRVEEGTVVEQAVQVQDDFRNWLTSTFALRATVDNLR